MDTSVETVIETTPATNDLSSLPLVEEETRKSMVEILDNLDVSEFKYKKPVPWEGRRFPARVVKVTDADTLAIVYVNNLQQPETISVRLHLIDAPETRMRKGVSKLQKATGLSVTNYVSSFLQPGSRITVAVREHCIYNNRVIGAVFFCMDEHEIDLSANLLSKRFVRSYSGEQKRAPWKDEELLSILYRLDQEHLTEEAKNFLLNVNGRPVSTGANHPAPAPVESSLVVPVLGDVKPDNKSETKSKKKKKTQGHVQMQPQIQQVPMMTPQFVMPYSFGIPGVSNQGGATMIIPQNMLQQMSQSQIPQGQTSQSQMPQDQMSPFQTGIPAFMPYPYMAQTPVYSQPQRSRSSTRGRGRAQK